MVDFDKRQMEFTVKKDFRWIESLFYTWLRSLDSYLPDLLHFSLFPQNCNGI